MHAVAGYNRGWHITKLPHQPPYPDTQFSSFTPKEVKIKQIIVREEDKDTALTFNFI